MGQQAPQLGQQQGPHVPPAAMAFQGMRPDDVPYSPGMIQGPGTGAIGMGPQNQAEVGLPSKFERWQAENGQGMGRGMMALSEQMKANQNQLYEGGSVPGFMQPGAMPPPPQQNSKPQGGK